MTDNQTITFGAGCFWGVEATFRKIPGVLDAPVGYMGGHTENPTYREVCSKTTGHAEVCRVEFDPARVRLEDLFAVFWQCHDPTQVNRQGPDVGSQYRSAIFCETEEQLAAAEQSKAALDASGSLPRPVATEVAMAGPFYRAEEYHQNYFSKNGGGACHI